MPRTVSISPVYPEVRTRPPPGGTAASGTETSEIDKEGDILYISLRFIDLLYKRDNSYLDSKIAIITLYFFFSFKSIFVEWLLLTKSNETIFPKL